MPVYSFRDDIVIPYTRETDRGKKRTTREREAYAWAHLLEFFGTMTLSNNDRARRLIRGDTVKAYRESRKLVGGVGAETIKRELAVACRAVNYMISEHYYECLNPFARRLMSDADRRAAASRPPQWETLTEGQERELLLACRPWCRDIVLFSLHTGFRQSETLALTWERIHGDEVSFSPEDQKSNRFGVRILDEVAAQIIARQPMGSETVFSVEGEPITRWKLRYAWEEARARVGLQGFQWHWLRKTAGQRWYDLTGDLAAVQHQLGHAEQRTTEKTYIRGPLDRQRAAAAAMAGRWSG